MKIITKENATATVKISKFTTITKGEYYILHNTLRNSIIKVNEESCKKFIDTIKLGKAFAYNPKDDFQKTLFENNIIVNEREDELSTLNSMYYDFERNGELCITLIVTRRCNFKCPYCYEVQENKTMEKQVYDKTIDFIIENIKRNKHKHVYISLFGGEPTLEAKNINKFLVNLNKQNNDLDEPAIIQAGITTNAYLLSPKVVDEFIKNKVVHYQITIDGLEETHNKSRILQNGKGTWNKIVENVKHMKTLKESFSVLIRSNISPEIYNNIDKWLDFLQESFNDDERFKFHFETVKNFGSMNDETFELCDNETDKLLDIIQNSKKRKLRLELISFNTQPFALVCYAARYASFLIDYDGSIKKCTSSMLDYEYNKIGSLFENMTIEGYKRAAAWTSYELPEYCKKCSILPLCYGRKCPIGVKTGEQCEMLRKLYYAGIDYMYIK